MEEDGLESASDDSIENLPENQVLKRFEQMLVRSTICKMVNGNWFGNAMMTSSIDWMRSNGWHMWKRI